MGLDVMTPIGGNVEIYKPRRNSILNILLVYLLTLVF